MVPLLQPLPLSIKYGGKGDEPLVPDLEGGGKWMEAEHSISVSEHNPKNWFLEGRWGFYNRKGQMEASELLHTGTQ